jgi:hypothetical protein
MAWYEGAIGGIENRTARRRIEQMKAWQEIYGKHHPD